MEKIRNVAIILLMVVIGFMYLYASNLSDKVSEFGNISLSKNIADQGIVSVLGINLKGDIVVFDPSDGAIIQTCEERAESDDPCKASVIKKGDGYTLVDNNMNRMNRKQKDDSTQRSGIKLLDQKEVILFNFEGSYCTTIFVGGSEHEVCVPSSRKDYLFHMARGERP